MTRRRKLITAQIFGCTLYFALSACGALCAQGLIGTWQGTLPITEKPRRTLLFTKSPDGTLKGVLYLDEVHVNSSIPLSTVHFEIPELTVAADLINISYEGKLSMDGKSMTGTWRQDKQSYPMTFVLATAETLWKYEGPTTLTPMPTDADPTFEVATIKPSSPDGKGLSYAQRTRRFEAHNATVRDLVKFAWHLRDRQIEGGPAWMGEIKYDIAAQPDLEGLPSPDQHKLMLRKLLSERFHMNSHLVQKEFPVYALEVEKSPPALTLSDKNVNSSARIFVKKNEDGQSRVQFSYMSMLEFDDVLMNFIKDRQIVDQTGLKGAFDFTLNLPPEALSPADAATPDSAPLFFQAVRTLRLKLEPKRATIDVLVIDHMKQPSAN